MAGKFYVRNRGLDSVVERIVGKPIEDLFLEAREAAQLCRIPLKKFSAMCSRGQGPVGLKLHDRRKVWTLPSIIEWIRKNPQQLDTKERIVHEAETGLVEKVAVFERLNSVVPQRGDAIRQEFEIAGRELVGASRQLVGIWKTYRRGPF